MSTIKYETSEWSRMLLKQQQQIYIILCVNGKYPSIFCIRILNAKDAICNKCDCVAAGIKLTKHVYASGTDELPFYWVICRYLYICKFQNRYTNFSPLISSVTEVNIYGTVIVVSFPIIYFNKLSIRVQSSTPSQ